MIRDFTILCPDHWPGVKKDRAMNRTKFIQEYLDGGFSLIPLKNNGKEACIKWKIYQSQRAGLEDILSWYIKFPGANIGIITGKISKLVVIDVDDPSKLPELFKRLPEAEKTTRVKTKRCCHFYFSNNEHKIKSTKNLFNLGIELHAEGRQMVGPPSKIDGFTYNFEIPLSEIKPLPNIIIESLGEKEGYQAPGVEYKKRNFLPLPRYNGLDRYCLKQILDRNLSIGERDNSLFILCGLLCQNKNKSEHAKTIVILKNNSLSKPLTDPEIKKVFSRRYNFKCSTVRETLPFVECDKCRFKFKGGNLGMGNILVKNIRKLPELSNAESKIALMLGTVFDGEYPSINKIAEKAKMDFRTVNKAIKKLKERGIIDRSRYS